jgi:hypothetical protein
LTVNLGESILMRSVRFNHLQGDANMLVTKFPDGKITVECQQSTEIGAVLAAMSSNGHTISPTAGSNGHGATKVEDNPATTGAGSTANEDILSSLPLLKGKIKWDAVDRVMKQIDFKGTKMELRSLLVRKREEAKS